MYIVVYSTINYTCTCHEIYIIYFTYKKFTQTIFPVDTIQDSQEVF